MSDGKSGIELPPGYEAAEDETAEQEQPEQRDPHEVLQEQLDTIKSMSMEDLTKGIEELRNMNRTEAIELQSQHGAQLDPLAVLMQRIEAIVLLGFDDEHQARINFAFEQAVNGMLTGAAQQIRMAALLQGTQIDPAQLSALQQGQQQAQRLPNGRPRRH